MNLRALAAAVSAGVFVGLFAEAAELVWQGGDGADFNTASNWSPAQTPTAADTVTFNNSATPSLNATDANVGNVKITAGTVEISGSKTFRFGPSGGTGTIDVASGASLKLSVLLYGHATGGSTVSKSGAGTLTLNKIVSSYINEVEVSAGRLELATGVGGDGFQPAGKLLTVRDGATFKTLDANRIANGVRIQLDAGATYDMNAKRDTIGAVTGEGSVINGADLYHTLYNGPHTFSGTTTANVLIYEKDSNYPPVEDKSVLIIGSANAFANAKLTQGNIVPSSPEKSSLRFAPGIGTFHIKTFVPSATQPLHLEDTEGKPVTVSVGFGTVGGTFTGVGSLLVCTGDSSVFYTNQLQNAGFLGATNTGVVAVGDNTLAHEPDLSTLSGLNAYLGGRVRLALAQPTTLVTPLAGLGGIYEFKSCPDLTLAAFSPTNCQVNLSGVCSNLTITGGVAKDTSLNLASMSADSALTISGGMTDGLTITPDHSPFAAHFTGGTHTNVTLSGKSATDAIGDYYVTGGSWTLGNDFAINGSHIFHVSGGRLAFEKGVKFGGPYSTNEFMIVATGGEIDIGPAPKNSYPRGLGMDLSGTARVMLPASGETLRISSDNVSHTIRLRDDAYLCIRSYTSLSNSDQAHNTTGRVEVAGGTLHMCSQFDRGTASLGPGSYMEVILNGGQLLLDTRDINVKRALFHAVNAEGMTMRLGAATSEIRVVADRFAYGTNINLPLTTDVPDGTDGGFVKTGSGTLRFERPVTVTGDIVVREGALATLSTETATPAFGSGTLYNLSRKVAFESAANHTVADVVCSGVASFDLSHTKSAASSVAFDSLTAEAGAAVILNDPLAAAVFDGSGVKATVKGGLANDATTGLVKAPVVLRTAPNGSALHELSHATYDSTLGFVKPAYVTTFATDGTGVTEVRSSAVTLSDNRHVAGLRVRNFNATTPLTINAGATLTVGNGTDPAFVLLSCSDNASHTKPQITGAGTLSFGTARGYVLSNLRLSDTIPADVACVIAGTGGLTVGGGVQDGVVMIRLSGANTYSGGTLVGNAHVEVTKATGFGAGAIEVMDGAAVKLSFTGALANALKLAGFGSYTGLANLSEYALYANGDVSLSGATTVDATVGAAAGAAFGRTLTFAGGVSGGVLTIVGEGTVVLPTANPSLSGLVVESGTVSVTQAASLGAGDVELGADGILRFDNTAVQTVANRLAGSGTIVLAGGAKVTFGDLTGFTGRVVNAAGAVVDLAGADLEVAGLYKNGAFNNTGAAATLSVNSAVDMQFDGTIAGDLSLVKKGAGRQAVAGALDYTGATTVAGGTLVLGALDASDTLPVADGKLFRLDAGEAATVDATKDLEGGVATWSDADGGEYVFSNKVGATKWPVYRTEAAQQVNGRNTIWFPGLQEKLIAAKSASLRTVALVMRPEATHPTSSVTGTWMCGGIFGVTDQDNGVRFKASASSPVTWPISDSLWGGIYTDVYINGVKTYDITHGVASLVWFDAGETISSKSWALGCYSTINRPYFGDFCEVVAYDRVLSEAERESVEDYLMVKWGIASQPAWEKRFNVLPATTDLTVEEGATVDFAGSTQELGSFDIAGTLANTADATAVLKVATGTCYLRETATVSPNVILDFKGGDAVLDLGGQTWTVTRFRGASTQVRNGTLVELKPEYGLMILVH